MKDYADLTNLPEDDRIATIAEYLNANPGDVVGICVDDDKSGKGDRYISKLTKLIPGFKPKKRSKLVEGIEILRVVKEQ